MSAIVKSLFNFSSSTGKDLQITSRISKLQGLIRDLQRQKTHDIQTKVKLILNAAFKDQKNQSLFQLIYKTAMKQSPVEWVPLITKIVELFSPDSAFMKIIFQAQDYKIPIEKNLIPNFLFRNNILNQKSGYSNITNSISGLIVPLLDYVYIKLLHSLSQLSFLEAIKPFNQQYQSDDLYFYISRNPYLLLLRSHIQNFSSSEKNLKRLSAIIKMFFIDQILIKHRINKNTGSYLKDFSFFSSNFKIQPHYFLVIFLFLKRGRQYFEEKDLYFSEVTQRFGSLIQRQSQIYYRFFFRLYVFAYSKSFIQKQVIDNLEKANVKEGYFQLTRYQTQEFKKGLNPRDLQQKIEYDNSKALLLKLLQKDQYLISGGKISFSTIRTLGCFLQLQIVMMSKINASYSSRQRYQIEENHKRKSEGDSLNVAIGTISKNINAFIKKQKAKKIRQFSQQNEKSLQRQILYLHKLYEQAYGRRIDSNRQDSRNDGLDRSFNIRGENKDFSYSIQTYKTDIEYNVWKIPLKESQYQILYNLFYWLAKKMDIAIPGHKNRKQPILNLRYLCNPIVFMIVMVSLVLLFKIFF